MKNQREKILNSLVAAACGDSLGSVTEQRSTEHIKEYFGGYVTDFVNPPDDNLAHGTTPGIVTDDFSIAYFSAEDWLKNDSRPNEELSKRSLVRWYDYGVYNRFIGPTTKASILKMKNDYEGIKKIDMMNEHFSNLKCENNKATNGAAMKAGIIGLFNPGNVDRAIDEAILFCRPSHNNTISLSGGCAIAAATAEAMKEGATYQNCIKAGIYGAREGFKRSESFAMPTAGASVERKIELAVKLGEEHADNFDEAMKNISEIIGGGLMAYEAVPACFGHIAACKGRIKDSVFMGVNAGDDTDTVACMTGFIVGALSNSEPFEDRYIDTIDKVNGFDIRKMAEDIYQFNLKENQ